VIGRSNIVGKPLVQLLLAENATVTVAHSKTRDLPDVCGRADLLFAAVGRSEMVRGHWIKPGATVIDVGINRLPVRAASRASLATLRLRRRVRGGRAHTSARRCRTMTIACLLANTVRAACALADFRRRPSSAEVGRLSVRGASVAGAGSKTAAPLPRSIAAAGAVRWTVIEEVGQPCQA